MQKSLPFTSTGNDGCLCSGGESHWSYARIIHVLTCWTDRLKGMKECKKDELPRPDKVFRCSCTSFLLLLLLLFFADIFLRVLLPLRLLGFNRIPPVVARLINVTTEIREITTDHRLSRTFFTSPGTLVSAWVSMHPPALTQSKPITVVRANICMLLSMQTTKTCLSLWLPLVGNVCFYGQCEY